MSSGISSLPEASPNPHRCISRVSTQPAGLKIQRGSNKLTDKQERTHGQTASLRSQGELRDHSRNRGSQPLGSAAPSVSGRRLCPDRHGKATDRPRLTSRPSHWL